MWSREGTFERAFECHGRAVLVRAPSHACLDWLQEFLGPGFLLGADPPAMSTIVTLRVDPQLVSRWRASARPSGREVEPFTMDGGEDHWPLMCDANGGQRAVEARRGLLLSVDTKGGRRTVDIVCSEDRPEGRVTLMRTLRDLSAAEAVSAGGLLLHAAAVAVGDAVTLFVGEKRTGKSTMLLHALGRPESQYVSNDRVVVDLGAGVPRVVGVPTIVRLREGSLDVIPGLREEVESGAWYYPFTVQETRGFRAAGTLPQPASTRVLAGMSPAQLCAVLGIGSRAGGKLERIVFPRVDPGLTGAPGYSCTVLEPEEAGRRLAAVGLLASGRLAPFLSGATTPDRRVLEERAMRLAGAVACHACTVGPEAYQEPAVWDELRAALA